MRPFRQKREALGLTIEATARILDTTPRNVQRWESEGERQPREPNPTAMRIMDWMILGFRPPEFPR